MREVVEFTVQEVSPSAQEVLEIQGMAGRANMPARIMTLLESALDLFEQLAVPKGLMAALKPADFKPIYQGNGLSAPENPVRQIYPKAHALALFAVTLGNPLTQKTGDLFRQGRPALGYMVEAVTTAGAERLGHLMSQRFREYLLKESAQPSDLTVLHYSPGNCGWDLSSQENIFRFLHPEEIGIEISSSFHMRPQKSLSGVLIAGTNETHRFRPDFQLCLQCKTHKCAQRLAQLHNYN